MRHPLLLGSFVFVVVGLCGLITLLPLPLNPVWQLWSGYYQYDPRHAAPPTGLMLDRPEDSLTYYLDASLKVCDGRYLAISDQRVQDYEVENVEYFGKGSIYAAVWAFSYVRVRLFYADGSTIPVTFRFQAGHNEGDMIYLDFGSVVRAGSWIAMDGLVPSPASPPPGWQANTVNNHLTTCEDVGRPYTIGPWEHVP